MIDNDRDGKIMPKGTFFSEGQRIWRVKNTMKKKISAITIMGILVAIGIFSGFQCVIGKPQPAFPTDAGGPYIGLANEVPVYFDGWADPGLGHYIEAWKWTFGDGEYAYVEDPVYMYTAYYDDEADLDAWDEIGRYGWDSADVRIWDEDDFELMATVHHWCYLRSYTLGSNQWFVCEVSNGGLVPDCTPPFDLTIDVYKAELSGWEWQGNIYEGHFESLAVGEKLDPVWALWETVGPTGLYYIEAKALFPDSDYVLEFDRWYCHVLPF